MTCSNAKLCVNFRGNKNGIVCLAIECIVYIYGLAMQHTKALPETTMLLVYYIFDNNAKVCIKVTKTEFIILLCSTLKLNMLPDRTIQCVWGGVL